MKKVKLWVVLTTLCVTMLSFTSCSKDDEKDNNNQNNNKETVYSTSEYKNKIFGEWEILEIREEYIALGEMSGTNNGVPYSYKKGDLVKYYYYKKGWEHDFLDSIILFDNNLKWGSSNELKYRGNFNINENTINITLTNTKFENFPFKYELYTNHFFNFTQIYNNNLKSWHTPTQLESGNQWKYSIEYLSDKKMILKHTYDILQNNGTVMDTHSIYYIYQNKGVTVTDGNMHITD